VISATLAEGGRGRNVIPDRFTLNVNHRFAPGRTPDDAEADLRALVDGEADVEVFDRSPSAPPHRHAPAGAGTSRRAASRASSPSRRGPTSPASPSAASPR
jgi:acetylornithine deacetylase/succinyl-diaminopimelate desuccinylase-like protein